MIARTVAVLALAGSAAAFSPSVSRLCIRDGVLPDLHGISVLGSFRLQAELVRGSRDPGFHLLWR